MSHKDVCVFLYFIGGIRVVAHVNCLHLGTSTHAAQETTSRDALSLLSSWVGRMGSSTDARLPSHQLYSQQGLPLESRAENEQAPCPGSVRAHRDTCT